MSLYEQGRDLAGYGQTPPEFRWPDNASVAVSIVVNYEEGSELSIAAGDARGEEESELGYARTPGFRDLATESAFQYGSRTGFWRLMSLLDSFRIPVTVFATAVALELNPEAARYLKNSAHEVACHGWRWEDVYALGPDEEWEHLQRAVRSITATTGSRPVGWYSRTQPSEVTRKLLIREGGFVYDSDAIDDDVPYFYGGAEEGHVVVPYTTIYNDSRFLSSRGAVGPTGFVDYCVRGLEYLADEGASNGRMMTVGLHPRIIGHAARMSALREFLECAVQRDDVWFASRQSIAEFWLDRFGASGVVRE